jgi:hypothetical protein
MFEIDSFYLIILSVAVFILILALGFSGWMLSKQNDQIDFPNITATCPDFWSISKDGLYCEQPSLSDNFNYGAENILTNYLKLGTSGEGTAVPGKKSLVQGKHTASSFDSKHADWGSGKEAVCNKRKWATDNNIQWDTVTNVNFC